MPVPDNPEALHGFLGMLNYLHEFIEDYNEKTAALHASLTNPPSGVRSTTTEGIWNPVAGHQQPTCAEIFIFDPAKAVKMSVDET